MFPGETPCFSNLKEDAEAKKKITNVGRLLSLVLNISTAIHTFVHWRLPEVLLLLTVCGKVIISTVAGLNCCYYFAPLKVVHCNLCNF